MKKSINIFLYLPIVFGATAPLLFMNSCGDEPFVAHILPEEYYMIDDSGAFTGIADNKDVENYNEIVVPASVTSFGYNTGNPDADPHDFYNLQKYPNITSIVFEEGSQCSFFPNKVSWGTNGSWPLRYITNFDTSNIVVPFAYGTNFFSYFISLQNLHFTTNFDGGGYELFWNHWLMKGGGTNIYIDKRPGNPFTLSTDLIGYDGSGDHSSSYMGIKSIHIDADVASIKSRAIRNLGNLTDLYLYGHAPADPSEIANNWLGNGGEDANSFHSKLRIHTKTGLGWLEILEDPNRTWNTTPSGGLNPNNIIVA